MIRIAFPASGLSVAIIIQDDTNTTVSSGVMTQEGALGNGMWWYAYSFDGIAGIYYHIMADAGATITDENQRYFDFFVEEPSTGGGGGGGLTPGQATQLANTVKKGDMILHLGKKVSTIL